MRKASSSVVPAPPDPSLFIPARVPPLIKTNDKLITNTGEVNNERVRPVYRQTRIDSRAGRGGRGRGGIVFFQGTKGTCLACRVSHSTSSSSLFSLSLILLIPFPWTGTRVHNRVFDTVTVDTASRTDVLRSCSRKRFQAFPSDIARCWALFLAPCWRMRPTYRTLVSRFLPVRADNTGHVVSNGIPRARNRTPLKTSPLSFFVFSCRSLGVVDCYVHELLRLINSFHVLLTV